MYCEFFWGMRNFLIVILLSSLCCSFLSAQEEESAELSLVEYSDAFQENFFEALKNYGIHNYEKAINYLLECKKLNANDEVIDFELGKNYLKLNQYYKAEEYILKAVQAKPDNIWYLDKLFEVYKIQKDTPKSIQIAEQLASKNDKYKENLITLYSKSGDFSKALKLLDELDTAFGVTVLRKNQRIYFTSLLNAQEKIQVAPTEPILEKENPLKNIQSEIDRFITEENYQKLLKLTEDATELYPSQSAFHYAMGLAQNKLGKHKEAITSLETALDFLIDNKALQQQIFKQLAIAYTAVGNIKKANEYQKGL